MFKKRQVAQNHQHYVLDDVFWNWYADNLKYQTTQDRNKDKESKNLMILKACFDNDKLNTPFPNQFTTSVKTPYCDKDVTKSFEFIRYFQLAEEGLFVSNSLNDKQGNTISLKGADNWNNVMCYLDALLFAMFVRLESFESMLLKTHQDKNVQRLATLLRVYVSMLRSGKLITVDLTKRLCELLQILGFDEAMSKRQEDCASLFQFLTETLSMPLLTLKIDIAHGGKFNKTDDHKYTKERILFVSIPGEDERENLESDNEHSIDEESKSIEKVLKESQTDTNSNDRQTEIGEGETVKREVASEESDNNETLKAMQSDEQKELSSKNADIEAEDVILLEECLEHYFNNSVEVKRELGRRATLDSLKRSNTLTTLNNSDNGVISYLDQLPENGDKLAPSADEIEYADGGLSAIQRLNSNISTNNIPNINSTDTSSNAIPFIVMNTNKSLGQIEEVPFPDIQSANQESPAEASSNFSSTPSQTSPLLKRKATNNTIATRGTSAYVSKSNSTFVTSRERSSTLSIWSMNKSKEVTLPAWMFLQLLPFYTDDNNEKYTTSSKEFVEKRPILPICLKRYSYSSSAQRSKKRIIIPPFINLPQFIADDESEEPYGSFKLVLESAICHRGVSINSGHYVSVVRKTPSISDSEDDENKSIWYLYDDMRKQKVVERTFKDIFSTEWPYMLFYRMVPFEDKSKVNIVVPEGSKPEYWTGEEEVVDSSKVDDGVGHLDLDKKFAPYNKFNLDKNPDFEQDKELQQVTEKTLSIDSNTIVPSIKSDAYNGNLSDSKTNTLKSHKSISHSHHIFKSNSGNSNQEYILPLPNGPGYVDIRDKYHWYFIDEKGNYQKEIPRPNIVIKEPSLSFSEDSGSISPRFRRNSQWSDNSNVSHSNGVISLTFSDSSKPASINKEDDLKVPLDEMKKLSISSSGSSGSFWKRKTRSKKNSPANSVFERSRTQSPDNRIFNNHTFKIDAHSETDYDISSDFSDPRPAFNSLKPMSTKELSRFKKNKKKLSKKKDVYKQEKCVIV